MKRNLESLTSDVVSFRERRDWKQFHHPKELSSALAIEVAEIMELFRFKSPEEVGHWLEDPENRQELSRETADCLFLLLLLAHDSGLDLQEAFEEKLKLLEERYPEDLVRGRNDKWTEYQ